MNNISRPAIPSLVLFVALMGLIVPSQFRELINNTEPLPRIILKLHIVLLGLIIAKILREIFSKLSNNHD